MREGFPRFDDALRGRERELADIERAAAPGAAITLVGPGGVGKTRLATEYATNHHSGAATFIALVNAGETDDIRRMTARALGLGGDVEWRRVGEEIASRDGEVIVFDNVEQVVEDFAALLSELPPGGATLLVTSREPLRIRGEQVVRLEGLDVDSARSLFEDRYRAAGVTDAGPEVDELVETLEGLPLALEIAAGRMTSMSAADFLERFRNDLGVASSRRRDVSERHGTLQAAIRWSWETLTAEERRALRRVSLFVAPFALDDAEAILDDVDDVALDLLSNLVDRSLLRFDPDAGRYSTLLAVRLFAHSTFDDDDRREVLEKLARYFVEHAEVDDTENVAGVRRELAGVETTDEQTVAVGEVLARLLLRRGEPEAAIDVLGDLDERDAPPELMAQKFVTETHAFQHAHQHEEAVAAGRKAVEFADRAEAAALGARARMNLAGSLGRLEEFDDALETLDRGEELARSVGAEDTVNAIIGNRAMVTLTAGRLDEAQEGFERVLERAERLDLPLHKALTLFHMAIVAHDRGAGLDELLSLLDRAHRFSRVAKHERSANLMRRFRAYVLTEHGRREEGLEALQEVLRLVEERGETTMRASVMNDIAKALELPEDRIERAEEALAASPQPALRAEILLFLAGEYVASGQTDVARARIIEATELVPDLVPSRALLESLKALSHAVDGDARAAKAAWKSARKFIDQRPDLDAYEELFEPAIEAALAGEEMSPEYFEDLDRQLGAYHRVHLRYGYPNPVPQVRRAVTSASTPGPPADVEVASDGSWLRIEGGEELDFSRRTTLRRLILFLADRAEAGDDAASVEELIEAGWPGESMTYDSGLNRVYSAVRTLRNLGLEDHLETIEEGYRLSPNTTVRIVDDAS